MSRTKKLEALLRKEIADIIQKNIGDSRIGFISITEVELSKDLSTAKVFYSQLGTEEEKKKTIKGLNSASGHIHYELCKRIRFIKFVPKLRFEFDNGIERGTHLLNVFKDL